MTLDQLESFAKVHQALMNRIAAVAQIMHDVDPSHNYYADGIDNLSGVDFSNIEMIEVSSMDDGCREWTQIPSKYLWMDNSEIIAELKAAKEERQKEKREKAIKEADEKRVQQEYAEMAEYERLKAKFESLSKNES